MTMPMARQPIMRYQVRALSPNMSASDTNIPMMGTKGTQGVLNGRGRSGRRTRKIQTPAETITKASSVPMLTSCPNWPMGITPPMMATKTPTMICVFQGVRNLGWISLAHFHSRPSRDME